MKIYKDFSVGREVLCCSELKWQLIVPFKITWLGILVMTAFSPSPE
jgi:hypothetical protein